MDILSTVLIVLGIAFIVIVGVFFVSGALFGAGYQPAPRNAVREALSRLDMDGKVFYDLGSGFGRTLFEAVRFGAIMCVGVEIDPLKCLWIRREAALKGLKDVVKVTRADLMKADISVADVVFVFLTPGFMRRLEPKVIAEMKSGSVVVSYDHKFEGLKPFLWIPEQKLRFYGF